MILFIERDEEPHPDTGASQDNGGEFVMEQPDEWNLTGIRPVLFHFEEDARMLSP